MSDESVEAGESSHGFPTDQVTTYLEWAALGVALLAAVFSGIGLYANVSRIISIWVSQPYQPVFAAALNLTVLLVAGAAMVWLARRLS